MVLLKSSHFLVVLRFLRLFECEFRLEFNLLGAGDGSRDILRLHHDYIAELRAQVHENLDVTTGRGTGTR